jgi:hypothetical protein
MERIDDSYQSNGRQRRHPDPPLPDRGLMLREPWISQILMSRKTWELRGISTKIRGRLALIRSGSGLILGECSLDDCLGPIQFETLIETGGLSQQERDEIEREGHAPYLAKDGVTSKTFAWIVSNPILYSRPVAYNHPSGAITFVDLTKPGVVECTEASSSTNMAKAMPPRQLQLL